jgi:hypothetical protein
MKQIAMVLTLLVITSSFSMAKNRIVKCRIDSQGHTEYKGKCTFMPGSHGSFTLRNRDFNRPLTDEISSVSLHVVSRGVGEVRGLTRNGINSRWGTAKRSKKRPACWKGADFRICAW